MDKHKVRWKFWHLFPFPLFKIRNTVDNGPSLSCFIIAPIQSTSFSPKNSQPWNLKLKLSRSGANIALHFVNPFIMRQPILIQFKMEKTNRALSSQRKSKKSHSGFNILATLMVVRPKNIIFTGFLAQSCALIKSSTVTVFERKSHNTEFLHRIYSQLHINWKSSKLKLFSFCPHTSASWKERI